MLRFVAIILGVCCALCATAQEKFTLSGYVRDSLSGETLIGATVSVNGHGKVSEELKQLNKQYEEVFEKIMELEAQA